jgi:hypothetical protein
MIGKLPHYPGIPLYKEHRRNNTYIYRVYKRKETFRNQAYCENLNAFSIAHVLNRGA